MTKKLEELAEQFIIGYSPLIKQERALYAHLDYIEEQLRLLDMHRERLLRVWKVISKKLMRNEE